MHALQRQHKQQLIPQPRDYFWQTDQKTITTMTFNNHLDYTIAQESYVGLSTADFLVEFSTVFELDPG